MICIQQHLMKEEQFLRLIQQICQVLKLSNPATKTVIQYFNIFRQSQTHQFPHEIMLAGCIFLVTKIFEQTRKIRDILNAIYIVINLYKKARKIIQEEQLEVSNINLEILQKIQNLSEMITPQYEYQQYNQYKILILQAQQHLLRIINYDIVLSETNSDQFKKLLITMKQLNVTPHIVQIAISAYNDLIFSTLEIWIPGILYFSCLASSTVLDQPIQKYFSEAWIEEFCTQKQKLQDYTDRLMNIYDKQQVDSNLQNKVDEEKMKQ